MQCSAVHSVHAQNKKFLINLSALEIDCIVLCFSFSFAREKWNWIFIIFAINLLSVVICMYASIYFVLVWSWKIIFQLNKSKWNKRTHTQKLTNVIVFKQYHLAVWISRLFWYGMLLVCFTSLRGDDVLLFLSPFVHYCLIIDSNKKIKFLLLSYAHSTIVLHIIYRPNINSLLQKNW